MIITITGKPCSGKGTVSKLFCKKYNFELKSIGDMMRQIALDHGYQTILDFQQNYKKMHEIDNMVDEQTANFGKQNINKDVVFDSRLAWYFIPGSFKVFIDVSWNTAGNRLMLANREHEKAESEEQAVKLLKARWQAENDRYTHLYNTNNLNPKNYNIIINSDNKTPEEIADEIYLEYKKFMHLA